MTTYADPTRCPDCGAPLPPAPQTCPDCGLHLTGANAIELFATFQRADALLAVLREARQPVAAGVGRVGRAQPSAPSAIPPLPPVTTLPDVRPAASPPSQAAARLRGASVPQILLSLGALCLLVAAITFLAVAWSGLGVSGRTLVLVVLTGTAFALTQFFFRRGLRTASETFSVVALGLLALDVVGARHAGWLGDAGDARLALMTGAVVATGALVLLVATADRPLVAPALVAPAAVLVAGFGAQAGTDLPTPMLLTVLVLLVMARLGRLLPSRPLVITAPALAVIPWAGAVASGFDTAGTTAVHVWGHFGAWPLVVAVSLAAAAGLVSDLPALTRPGGAAAALLSGYVLALPALDNGTTAPVVALLAVTTVWSAVAALPPHRWRAPAAVAAAGSAVVPAAAAGYLLGTAIEALATVGAPFTQPVDVAVAPTTPEVAPWVLAPALVVLAAAACAVVSVPVTLRRTAWLTVGGSAAVVGLVATLPLHDVPLALVVGLLTAIGAAALLGAGWRPARIALELRALGLVVLGTATVVALPNAVLTTAVLILATVAAALLMQRADLTGDVAAAVLPVALAGLVWSAAEVAGVPEVDRAIPIMLLVGGLAIWRPQVPLEVAAALAGGVAAAASVWAADDVRLAWAIHLTVAGALVTASALVHPSRRLLAWPGGLLLAAATWVRLAQLGVHQPEAYTLPTALVLTALGVRRLWHDERATTLVVLAPGLVLAAVPSLLATLDDPVSLRTLLLGTACLGLVLGGAALRWSAPLVVGAVVGAVLVLRVLAPYAASVPTWVAIGASGVLLLVAGVTWESRLRDLRKASRCIGGLR